MAVRAVPQIVRSKNSELFACLLPATKKTPTGDMIRGRGLEDVAAELPRPRPGFSGEADTGPSAILRRHRTPLPSGASWFAESGPEQQVPDLTSRPGGSDRRSFLTLPTWLRPGGYVQGTTQISASRVGADIKVVLCRRLPAPTPSALTEATSWWHG